ncbi:site-specific integrase [Sulfurimonas lithotrophica]|uniref:Site-specific integrase n=1 Tax=Sulfurimonas lithotrophica TaxID=2590022 RepID=A0A5P8P2G3_9BACT|nr:site-specific integrase [Sulfurimonas lithotrophica]QFR49865.1 site-specific integrase [Sulfurimonas lithotrophica]
MSYNKSGVYVRNNIIYVQGNIDGIFYRKSTKKKDTKANLLWAKKNAQSVLLQLIGKKDTTKTYLLKDFGYKSLEINSSNRKENTNKDYLKTFELHIEPKFGKWDLRQIRPTDIKSWQNDLGKKLSGKRIMNIRTIFRGILQDAFIDELIPINPFDRVKPPKVEKSKINPCSLEEVKTITSNANGWFKNYLLIAFFTGLRVGEMIALKWEDIDFSNDEIDIKRSTSKRIISTPKTAKSIRTIDMLPVVKSALLEQSFISKSKSEFVFINQYGKNFMDPTNLTKRHWKPLLEKLKIEYRVLYQTRHTFASLMLQQREEIGWVSEMMGHTDIHTTLTKYARFIPRQNKKRAKFLNNIDFGSSKSAQKLHKEKKKISK